VGAVNPQIHGSHSPIEALLDAPRRGLLDADGAERAQERPKKNRTRHRRKRWKSNRYRAPARRNEYERVVNIARDFSLCRWARRLLLDRRCANLSAAFSVPVAAWRPSFVRPATGTSDTAPVIAHAPLAGVLGVKPTVGISARSTVGSRVLRDRSSIAIVDASRITVHFQIAPLVYLMRARRTP
jgi:hypothetical protein